jgi:hypothetical protein
MGDASSEQVRELIAEEMDLVTGAFLGKLMRKVGRSVASVVQSPPDGPEPPAERLGGDD